jgi:hypothetical protein
MDTIEFTATPSSTGFARQEYHTVIPFVGAVVVRKEATTHAYPRGASNPMWRVYVEGSRCGTFRYLGEAQQAVRRLA